MADNRTNCIKIIDLIVASGNYDITSWVSVKILFGLAYGLLFIIGLIGNGSVLVSVGRSRQLRSARNIFLLNLILTDIILCVTAIPVTPWYALSKSWIFGSIMCRLMPFSNSWSVFVTSWSLTAISIDKFIHITDPTRASIRIRRALLITTFIWLSSSLINIPYGMSYDLVDGTYYVQQGSPPICGLFCDELNWHGDTARRLYGSAVVLLQFVLPLAIISYCYRRIQGKVSKDMIIRNKEFSESLSSSQRLDAIRRKRKVNYILIGMIGAFIGCWLPLTTVNSLKDFNQEPKFMESQPYFWSLLAHLIAMSTVVWNPLLFFWLTMYQRQHKGKRLKTIFVALNLCTKSSPDRAILRNRPQLSTNRSTDSHYYMESFKLFQGNSRSLKSTTAISNISNECDGVDV